MSRKRDELRKQASEREPDVKIIYMGSIVRHPRLRLRIKMRRQKIGDYARAYRAGAQFPPIEVVKDGEAYLLVDGFHRFAALRENGAQTVEARITEGDINRAMIKAATANTQHGMGWTAQELRQAFSMYMKARGFINEKSGRPKSYQDIADDFGGIKSKWTIGRWIKQKHGKVYERYYQADDESREPQQEEGALRGISYGHETVTALERAAATFKGIQDPEQRGRIITLAEQLVEEMKKGGPWKLSEEDF